MISEAALKIAREHADRDMETLVRLIREGKVKRAREVGQAPPKGAAATAFVEEVERLVRPPVNTAIRPKKRRRR